ncbi:ArsB/NhaD family transporter [Phytomonospora sp. NPDC050363]|uniref:SLC13 family permease n=1 Tax=Phytomonospora sp. NPDC050363 TaxID=3155642 RepID=UPI0033D4C160
MDKFDVIAACVIFLAAYVLIATEKINRVAVALGGAGLMLILRITDAHHVFFDEATGIEWNVIFLLLGMMVIVGVLRPTGVFEFVAIWAAKRGRGRPFRVMVLLIVITALASALLDNVTTVLLVVPVTLLICKRLDVSPVPFLLAEVFASNIGGASTLVGDPPNIIIAAKANLTFNDFLVHMAPIAIVLVAVLIGLSWLLFGRKMSVDSERAEAIMRLSEKEAIRDRTLLVKAGVVLVAVLAAFVLHPVLHYEPSIVALLGAGILVMITKLDPAEAMRDVEWHTLAFFAGLFIMIGGLVNVGVIGELSAAAGNAVGDNLPLAAGVLVWGSGVLSAIVDNIPYVASMSPIVVDLVGGDPDRNVLWWSLALGADLGGNATIIGASANVVVAGIAARNGHPIGFWKFAKYGVVVTVITLAISHAYIWLRYLA